MRVSLGLFVMAFALVFANESTAADVFGATVTVSALPSTFTQCRVPEAYESSTLDEVFLVLMDTDGNSSTGLDGVDARIVVYERPLATPCAPSTAAVTESFLASLQQWNGSFFEDSGVPVALMFDFGANKIEVDVPLQGPLLNLPAQAKFSVETEASYVDTTNQVALATDDTAPMSFTSGSEQADAADDLQYCDANCPAGSDWYRMIDLVDVQTGPTDGIFQSGF